MPILPAEPDIYPHDLFQEDAPTADDVTDEDDDADGLPRWWCLHTRPRQEKATARFLRDRCLPHFLPQVAKEGRTPGGRKTRSVVPLFPGYVFLKGGLKDRLQSFRGETLVNVLEVGDQEQIDRDLRQIHRMIHSGLPVVPEPDYPAGTRVRILSGPLEGMIGTVVRRGNRDHFVALVHFLGRGATVDLEGWQIERTDD